MWLSRNNNVNCLLRVDINIESSHNAPVSYSEHPILGDLSQFMEETENESIYVEHNKNNLRNDDWLCLPICHTIYMQQ